MTTMHRQKIVLALSLSTSLIFAEDSLEHRVATLEQQMQDASGRTILGNEGARFASGSPALEHYWGFSVWGDALFWRAYEGGTEYVYTTRPGSAVSAQTRGDLKIAQFDWTWGWRFGADYECSCDNWDFGYNYTRFDTDAHRHRKASSSGSLFPILEMPGTAFALHSAHVHWDLDFSYMDLELGRSYFPSRYLYLRPHTGLRWAIINQHVKVQYEADPAVPPATNSRNTFRNNFNGVGLVGGLDSKWFFNRCWSFYADAAAALLYGRFHVKNNERVTSQSGAVTQETHFNAHVKRIVPAAQINFGIGYETNFAKDRYHVGLKLGYELQYWWRQNQLLHFLSVADFIPAFKRNSFNLGLNGVTLDCVFRF